MRRTTAAVLAVLALVVGLLAGTTAASALTSNDSTCRKAAGITSASPGHGNIVAYDACRFDKLDASVAALKPSSTPTPSPTVSPTASPTPSATPTKTASPTPSPTPTAPAGGTCTNPSITFTGQGSQGVGNGYDISAEQWGVKAGYKSTLRYCSKDSWNVDITAADDGQHAVQSYPSIRRIYHDWSTSDFTRDPRLSTFPQLKVDFAVASPATCPSCIYETAFDNWFNGIGNSGSEQMIWLRNVGQRPAGNPLSGTVQISGSTWVVWKTSDSKIVSFVPTSPIDAGTVDVKAFVQYQVDHGYMPANSVVGGDKDPAVGQVSLGVEPVKVDGQRWDFNGFRLTDS